MANRKRAINMVETLKQTGKEVDTSGDMANTLSANYTYQPRHPIYVWACRAKYQSINLAMYRASALSIDQSINLIRNERGVWPGPISANRPAYLDPR